MHGDFALPSKHAFRPDPLHPTWCALCGRSADAHEER